MKNKKNLARKDFFLSDIINIRNLVIFSIILLAAVLRSYGLNQREIWYDEALTIIQAEKGFMQILRDVPTPIHYWIVSFFLNFGKNTFSLGLPSVILGVLSVFMVYKIGKKYISPATGIISSFLFAISPMHIEFSQQILHYSYFVFFALLSVFFVPDILMARNDVKSKIYSVTGFTASSLLNILTHVSAIMLFANQLVFLFIGAYSIGKFRLTPKKIFLVISLFLAGILILFSLGAGYYLTLFWQGLSFGINKPLQIGFSLAENLGSNTTYFTKEFYRAMFSWFGFGSQSLKLYLILFLFGIISLVGRKKFLILFYFLFLLFAPFIELYLVRPVHWFEEKYFIFMIPIYLLIIGEGVVFSGLTVKKLSSKVKLISKSLQIMTIGIILLSITILSIKPIKTRTIYGFPGKQYQIYSWKEVYGFLERTLKSDDRVFVRAGEGIFFEYYFPLKEKNKVWFDENMFLSLNADDYENFIRKKGRNYFVTIPDFPDTYLSGVASARLLQKKGGFNIYDVTFKKRLKVPILAGKDPNWQYYEDFRTSKYLVEADSWKNLSSTYLGNFNLPLSYGYFSLSPNSNGENYLDYKISWTEDAQYLYLEPYFVLDKDAEFNISFSNDGSNWQKIYSKESEEFNNFNPRLKLNSPDNRILYLRFNFGFKKNSHFNLGRNYLKSIFLYSQPKIGVDQYETLITDSNIIYNYDSQLEIFRSNKWLQDSIERSSWVQATDGILFTILGSREITPLMYEFSFPQPVSKIEANIKTYTFDNKMQIFYKLNDKNDEIILSTLNNKAVTTDSFQLGEPDIKKITFGFRCLKSGPTCQLRDFKFTALSNLLSK